MVRSTAQGRGRAAGRARVAARRERAVSSSDSIAGAGISILEEHESTGAPLDGMLSRYIRSRRLGPAPREELNELVLGVTRCRGRLDWRLRNVGVMPSPRTRLLADHVLSGRSFMEVGFPITAAERSWLRTLTPPLEVPSMEEQARLECPDWAWDCFRATFGDERVGIELSAL